MTELFQITMTTVGYGDISKNLIIEFRLNLTLGCASTWNCDG